MHAGCTQCAWNKFLDLDADNNNGGSSSSSRSGSGMTEVPNQATAKTETALATQGGLAVAAREDREVPGRGAQEVGGPEVQVALEVEVPEDLGQTRAPTHKAMLLD